MHRTLALILLLGGLVYALLSGVGQAPKGPPSPYVAKDACPFEGCMYGQWSVLKPTPIYESIGSGAVIETVLANTHVEAVTGEVHVVAGLVEVRASHTAADEKTTYKKGDKLYLLDYLGEGFTNVWFNGQIISDDLSDVTAGLPRATWAKLVKKPVSTWWVKVTLPSGKTGWTNQPENFGNKDRFE